MSQLRVEVPEILMIRLAAHLHHIFSSCTSQYKMYRLFLVILPQQSCPEAYDLLFRVKMRLENYEKLYSLSYLFATI